MDQNVIKLEEVKSLVRKKIQALESLEGLIDEVNKSDLNMFFGKVSLEVWKSEGSNKSNWFSFVWFGSKPIEPIELCIRVEANRIRVLCFSVHQKFRISSKLAILNRVSPTISSGRKHQHVLQRVSIEPEGRWEGVCENQERHLSRSAEGRCEAKECEEGRSHESEGSDEIEVRSWTRWKSFREIDAVRV